MKPSAVLSRLITPLLFLLVLVAGAASAEDPPPAPDSHTSADTQDVPIPVPNPAKAPPMVLPGPSPRLRRDGIKDGVAQPFKVPYFPKRVHSLPPPGFPLPPPFHSIFADLFNVFDKLPPPGSIHGTHGGPAAPDEVVVISMNGPRPPGMVHSGPGGGGRSPLDDLFDMGMDDGVHSLIGDILHHDPDFVPLKHDLPKLFPIEFLPPPPPSVVGNGGRGRGKKPSVATKVTMKATYVPSDLDHDIFNFNDIFDSALPLVPHIIKNLQSAPKDERFACEDDVAKLQCTTISTLFCLGLHKDDVSPKCRDKIRHSVPFACAHEIQEHCTTSSLFTDVAACLNHKEGSLSKECMVSLQHTHEAVGKVGQLPHHRRLADKVQEKHQHTAHAHKQTKKDHRSAGHAGGKGHSWWRWVIGILVVAIIVAIVARIINRRDKAPSSLFHLFPSKYPRTPYTSYHRPTTGAGIPMAPAPSHTTQSKKQTKQDVPLTQQPPTNTDDDTNASVQSFSISTPSARTTSIGSTCLSDDDSRYSAAGAAGAFGDVCVPPRSGGDECGLVGKFVGPLMPRGGGPAKGKND
ncbi:unnamed protein product [Vitrella brassicaformis CCMP3155]|uniref:FZ domain-containing protein n=1 Tax=Vitrella brassicaformis (strain CCMP3155) TaxID=1169540 RepID=A0A0G4FHX9_VITBC|nr:unnamed protein product [Vitrella brassicaformis CCMP3155]|eukprot:CEM12703.1 unnamed protein product [Vitrella brassicaformis CCMP3155]